MQTRILVLLMLVVGFVGTSCGEFGGSSTKDAELKAYREELAARGPVNVSVTAHTTSTATVTKTGSATGTTTGGSVYTITGTSGARNTGTGSSTGTGTITQTAVNTSTSTAARE